MGNQAILEEDRVKHLCHTVGKEAVLRFEGEEKFF